MKRMAVLCAALSVTTAAFAEPGQGDRIYTADQSSNTVTVINPATNEVLGTIALGAPRIDKALAPVNKQQENVHGLGFSRDGRFLVVVSVSSNAAQVIDTATNRVVQTTYVGRSPHEAFISPDGQSVWVAVRGESHVAVITRDTGEIVDRIETTEGPSKVVFSPDGKRAYVNHLFTNELSIIDVESRKVTDRVPIPEEAGGSADLAVSPDGKEVWLGHPGKGKTTVVDPATLAVKAVLDSGPRTNHPNFATVDGVDYAYVTVGGLNHTKVYRRKDEGEPELTATIENSGAAPHGIWPSPDGTRLYVALQKSDAVDVIDTATNKLIDTLRVGQDPQALVYVEGAVPDGEEGTASLSQQGLNARVENLPIEIAGAEDAKGSANIRTVSGLEEIDISVRGLPPEKSFSVFATKGEAQQVLRSIKSDKTGGVDEALAFADFFDNYDGLKLVPDGQQP